MNKVFCPWCGQVMELEHFGDDESEAFAFVCPDCAAESPISYSEESARATALSRPLQKPLTLEEACGSKEPCVYLEQKDGSLFAAWVKAYEKTILYSYSKREDLCAVSTYGKNELFEKQKYNKTWRCWEAKPTYEERMAVKWDD